MLCVSALPIPHAEQELSPTFEPREGRLKPALRPTAFVIDDEPIIADTISQILRLSGFHALPFYSGKSAIEQANFQCPSVVITDVAMPDLNGIETAKLLMKSCPSTIILLLLSGQAAAKEMIRNVRSEGFHFELLAKPLPPDDLLSALHRRRL